jgi:hypothetical protein
LRRLTLVITLIGVLTSVVAARLTLAIGSSSAEFVLSLTAVTLGCLALGLLGLRREGSPFSPLFLIAVVLSIFYVLRPAYVISDGRIGPTRAVDDRWVNAQVMHEMVTANWLVVLAIASLAIGYVVYGAAESSDVARVPGVVRRGTTSSGFGPAAGMAVACTGLLAFGSYLLLIRGAGGLHAYLSALSVRSEFFFGRGYLAAAPIPFKAVVLVLLAMALQWPAISRRQRLGLALLLIAVLTTDFLSGGRAALLLGTVLPASLLFHYVRRPLRLRTLFILALIMTLAFVAMRVVFRDATHVDNRGVARSTLVLRAFRDLPSNTIGGRDAVPYDSLVELVHVHNLGAGLQWGSTYRAIFTYPIPRRLWPGKPLGGGNAWFTQTYFPDFYAQGNVETSISYIGELYANFGSAGIVLGFFGLGIATAIVGRRLRRSADAISTVVSVVTVAFLIQLLRGDAFHSVTTWVLTVAAVQLASKVVANRSPHAVPTPAVRTEWSGAR